MADLEGTTSIDVDAPIQRCFQIIRSLDGARQLEDRGGGRTRATYSLEIGLNRALGLLRRGVRGPAETKVRDLLANRPVEGLKREAER